MYSVGCTSTNLRRENSSWPMRLVSAKRWWLGDLIARSIEHLQRQGIDRIDIVYVCSNADIARQNVQRLNVTGRQEFNLPTRITMLPCTYDNSKRTESTLFRLRPASFDLKSRGGMQQERALLYRLLSHVWKWPRMRHVGVFELLRGGASLEGFRYLVGQTPKEIGPGEHQIDAELAAPLRPRLPWNKKAHSLGLPSLHERSFEDLSERYRRARYDVDWTGRLELVGELRHTLARSCVNALQPDLVILDEFQRFRKLLDGDDAASELAQHLFDQPGARVLLLSATPYKMFTLPEEAAAQDNHYADFLRTTRFLMEPNQAARFEIDLGNYRQALHDLEGIDIASIRKRRKRVEGGLRRVMSRTERLSVTEEKDGMLVERSMEGTRLQSSDLRSYLAIDKISRLLGAGDALEYWKSAPYLLNFMESYKLKRTFRDALDGSKSRQALEAELTGGASLIAMRDIEAYRRIDPANARLRGLIHNTLDDGEVWRMLWLPPSLPYYELGQPFNDLRRQTFTKRLIFSAWWVVPQVIAALVSYEAERCMVRAGRRNWRNTQEARKRVRPLLRFQRRQHGEARRAGGMPLFALMYPSPALARLGDPLALSSILGGPTGPRPSLDAILAEAERRVSHALSSVVPATAPQEGPVDERWYWVAPLLLDAPDGKSLSWLTGWDLQAMWRSEDDVATDISNTAVSEAIAQAVELAGDPTSLGRPPTDLPAVLAQLAIAGPGTCALRSLGRVAEDIDLVDDDRLRTAAARVSWGFRSLFNVPEVTAMLRGRGEHEDVYWRQVLDYCSRGCLQAVLDEYAHVLREWLGIIDRDVETIARELARAMYEALTVRAPSYRVEDIRADGRKGITVDPKSVRARFALRFGSQSAEETGELQRASQVRGAFNSPFWPFILATTSVGQEGLDFHLYCHAVVHWNLPANPVDLEQREGRVHRYKGHAIRKNVAAANAPAAFKRLDRDPWEAMFNAARVGRDRAAGDLVPYWVYAIEGARESSGTCHYCR